MDHQRNEAELWEISKAIPGDQKLNQLLKELESITIYFNNTTFKVL